MKRGTSLLLGALLWAAVLGVMAGRRVASRGSRGVRLPSIRASIASETRARGGRLATLDAGLAEAHGDVAVLLPV